MARIDSHEEHLAIQVMDVVVGLMLSVAFALPSAKNAASWSRLKTIMGASLIWLGVSGSLLTLHGFQIYARTTLAYRWHTHHAISQIYDALNNFHGDCGAFPSEEQGLTALCTDPGLAGWNGPYIPDSDYLDDLWHHRFQYALRDDEPFVWSFGPDGISGTDDDITVAFGKQARSEK